MSFAECRSARIIGRKKSLQIKSSDISQAVISLFMRWHSYRMAINDLRTLDYRLLPDADIRQSGRDEKGGARHHKFHG